MHFVTEEHGNSAHGHTHDHAHHDHEHHHSHAGADAMKETVALVGYMTRHNKDHAKELEELADKLNKRHKHHTERASLAIITSRRPLFFSFLF